MLLNQNKEIPIPDTVETMVQPSAAPEPEATKLGDGVLESLVQGGMSVEKMYLLQHLFNNWYRDLSLDKMSAAAVVTGLVIFLLILGLWKAWGKGGAE